MWQFGTKNMEENKGDFQNCKNAESFLTESSPHGSNGYYLFEKDSGAGFPGHRLAVGVDALLGQALVRPLPHQGVEYGEGGYAQ